MLDLWFYEMFAPLFAAFEFRASWWEATLIGRKLVLVLVSSLIVERPIVQAITTATLLMAALSLHLRYMPYLDTLENNLELFDLANHVLVLLGGAVPTRCRQSPPTARRTRTPRSHGDDAGTHWYPRGGDGGQRRRHRVELPNSDGHVVCWDPRLQARLSPLAALASTRSRRGSVAGPLQAGLHETQQRAQLLPALRDLSGRVLGDSYLEEVDPILPAAPVGQLRRLVRALAKLKSFLSAGITEDWAVRYLETASPDDVEEVRRALCELSLMRTRVNNLNATAPDRLQHLALAGESDHPSLPSGESWLGSSNGSLASSVGRRRAASDSMTTTMTTTTTTTTTTTSASAGAAAGAGVAWVVVRDGGRQPPFGRRRRAAADGGGGEGGDDAQRGGARSPRPRAREDAGDGSRSRRR